MQPSIPVFNTRLVNILAGNRIFSAASLHFSSSVASIIGDQKCGIGLAGRDPRYYEWQVKLDADPGVVCFCGQGEESEVAVGAPYLAASGGKVYFEVVSDGDIGCKTGAINVGLAGTNFRGSVVNRCEASWSIYRNFVAYHRSAWEAKDFLQRVIDT
jgi:hypothetical protein